METENIKYYKYKEESIKKMNFKLWEIITISNTEENITFKEKFYLYENNIKLKPKCYCNGELKFSDMKNGFRKFCSKKCMANSTDIKSKRKNTNLEKWGVDNPSKSEVIRNKVIETNKSKFGKEWATQSDSIKDKMKETFIKNFGVDNPSKIKEIREKAENTMLEKFGVRHAMQNDDIKDKLKGIFIENWGVDNPSKIKEIRERAENTMLEKFGVRHAMQNEEVKIKAENTMFENWGGHYVNTEEYKNRLNDILFKKNSSLVNNIKYELMSTNHSEYLIKCIKCGEEFTIQRQLWRNRAKNGEVICLKCNPVNNGTSIAEKSILNYIKDIYNGRIDENIKIDGKEIDIYLPDLKLGFEYNGLYWHSEINKSKNYHYDKYKHFNSIGVNLFQIWEDDWSNRQKIVKSIINNKLGLSNKIWARKCEVREINDNKLVKSFLEENHIQGFVGSKIKIGLFHEGNLVSIMTFGNLRKSLGQKTTNEKYELIRFCNLINTSVVGGASKLFKYFLNNFKIVECISYSLNDHSTGNLYKNLGFHTKSETVPNYFWCKSGIRYHRFNFRKDKLVKIGCDINKTEVEIMYELGYFRVFDSGSKKWIKNA